MYKKKVLLPISWSNYKAHKKAMLPIKNGHRQFDPLTRMVKRQLWEKETDDVQPEYKALFPLLSSANYPAMGHWKQLEESSNELESGIKKKTFELFRNDSRNIEILTYDELYARARYIVEGGKKIESDNTTDDIPF